MRALFNNVLIILVTVAAVLLVEELLDFYKSPIDLSNIGYTLD